MIFISISKTMIGHDAFLLIHCTIVSRSKFQLWVSNYINKLQAKFCLKNKEKQKQTQMQQL